MDAYCECNDSDLQHALDVKNLEEIYCSLAKMPILDNVKFRRNHIDIDIDEKELLKKFLSFKTYILPDWLSYQFLQLKTEEKVLLLESTLKTIEAGGKTEFEFTFEEIKSLFATAKLYNFNEPVILNNGYLAYVPEIPDYLYSIYIEISSELLPSIRSAIPQYYLCDATKDFLVAVAESDTFEEIREKTGVIDAKGMVWKYLNLGYLRFV